jgi:hypothetical protein
VSAPHWLLTKLTPNKFDFPYYATINTGMDNIAASVARTSTVSQGDIRTQGFFSSTDFSHMHQGACIVYGTRVAEAGLALVGRTKSDTTPPVLQSVVCSTNGLTVTATFDKAINPGVTPFWRQTTIGTKSFSCAVSGSTVVYTLHSPIHIGQSITWNYTKNVGFEENIQDIYGNEIADYSNIAITNNSTVVSPTLTLIKAFNFSASADGWVPFSGGSSTVTFNQTVGGETACLSYNTTQATGQLYNAASGMVGGSINTYRIPFRIYIPKASFYQVTKSVPSVQMQLSGAILLLNLVPSLLKPDTWLDFEAQFLNTAANDDVLYPMSGMTSGQVFSWKGISIYRVT